MAVNLSEVNKITATGGRDIVATGGVSSSKKKKKRKGAHGFLANLVDDVDKFAHGVFPGLKQLGSDIYSDYNKLRDGDSSKSFKTDDFVKATAADYKHRYYDTYKKDGWGGVFGEMYQHPLAPILDVATVFTGGAAAAGKVAKGAAKVGKGGAASTRIARIGGFVERTPESLAKAEKAFGKESKQLQIGKEANLVRGTREIGKNQLGETYSNILYKPAPTNPLHRLQQSTFDKVFDTPALTNAPILGSSSRIARADARRLRIDKDKDKQNILVKPARAVSVLSTMEQVVWGYKHQGINPDDHLRVVKDTLATKNLDEIDKLKAKTTINILESKDFRKRYNKPNHRINNAVNATKNLTDDDMMKMFVELKNGSGVDTNKALEQFYSRKLLPTRINEGAKFVTEHPEDLQPTVFAEKAKQKLAAEKNKREKDLSLAQKDYMLMPQAGIRQADALRQQADLIDRQLAKMLSVDDVKKIDPKSVKQRVDYRRTVPSEETVLEMLQKAKRKLSDREYSAARKNLNKMLNTYYNLVVYGTASPTKKMVMQETKRIEKLNKGASKTKTDIGLQRMQSLIDKNPWDKRLITAANNSGGMRQTYLRLIQEARSFDAKKNPVDPTSIDDKLRRSGIDPLDRNNNSDSQYSHIADNIEEWVNETRGSVPTSEDISLVTMIDTDMPGEYATLQGLVQEAYRRGLIDKTSTDLEVVSSIAEMYTPDYRKYMPRKEFVDRMTESLVQIFERNPDDKYIGDVLQRSSLNSPEGQTFLRYAGMDATDFPTDNAFAESIRGLLTKAGFDENYRGRVQTLSNMQRMYDREGVNAFATSGIDVVDESFDPYKVDLERLHMLPASTKRKLIDDPSSLVDDEIVTINAIAASMRKTASDIYNGRYRGSGRLVNRIDRLSKPSARERELYNQSLSLEPTKLDKPELLNPETGRLFSEELPQSPSARVDILKNKSEGLSYLGHRRASDRSGMGGMSTAATVKNQPKLPASMTKQNLGYNYSVGAATTDPRQLIQDANNLLTGIHNQSMMDAMVMRGVPFSKSDYLATGGKSKWVVLPANKVPNGYAADLTRLSDTIKEVTNLADSPIPSDVAKNILDDIESFNHAIARNADELGDNMVMIPRKYYNTLSADIKQSSKFARMMIDKPLNFFRFFALTLRPAYYVNNLVGNIFMTAMKDGVGFVPRYISFIARKDTVTARQLFKSYVKDTKHANNFYGSVLSKYAPALKGASHYNFEMNPLDRVKIGHRMLQSDKKLVRIPARIMRIPDAVNDIASIMTDDMPRMYRFHRLITPHVKAARKRGMSGNFNEIAAKLLDNDPVLRTRLEDQVLDDLIDYRGMSDWERRHMRRIVPFYSWLRGITLWTTKLGYEHPEQLLALNQLQNYEYEKNKDFYESVPRYMRGSMIIGNNKDGVRVVNTSGLNPIGTVGDIAVMGQGLIESPDGSAANRSYAGQINPFLRAGIQSLFNEGKDSVTGFDQLMPGQIMASDKTLNEAPADSNKTKYDTRKTSRILQIPGTVLGGLPQSQLVSKFRTMSFNETVYGAPNTPTSMYNSQYGDYLKSYLGYPTRTVNMSGAKSQRDNETMMLNGEGRIF